MRKITIFLFCSFGSLLAFSQEKALENKVDAFMKQNRAGIHAFLENEGGVLDSVKLDPFVKAYRQFRKEHGSEYAALRKERYAQYAPPPAGLQQLKWQTGGDWGNSLDLMSIAFMRSYEPGFISQIVYYMTIPRIASMTAAPIEEVQTFYKVRTEYGILMYTKPVSDSIYEVWSANRIFAVNFRINVYSGTLSAIRFNLPKDPAYTKIQWTTSVVKPIDEATKLQGDLNQAIWNRTTTVNNFFLQNMNRFKLVREERLQPDVKDYTPAKSGYKELPEVAGRIKQDTLTSTFMYPEQWETSIQSAGILGDHAQEMAMRMRLNTFFGSARYVKQLDKDRREVWLINDTDRIYYIWNIFTGKIEQPRYWIKE